MVEESTSGALVDVEAVWARFCDGLKALGNIATAPGTPTDDVGRAETFQFLTHALRNNFERHLECADPNFPWFFRSVHETQRLGNAENHYLMSVVRGTRDYVIRGTRGTAHNLQFSSYVDKPVNGSPCTGALDARDMEIAPDGSFEVQVSSKPQTGNWLPMLPNSSMLQVRNTYGDRSREKPAEVTIAAVDAVGGPPPMTSALLEQRLQAVLNATRKFALNRTSWYRSYRESGWINCFGEQQELWQSLAAVPDIHYLQGAWDLQPDEALIIESDHPDSTNWVLQINNCMMEALDYRYYRISITRSTAELSPDGKLRIVLAHRDPDVPNWLEAAGHTRGAMVWRWMAPAALPQVTTRLVKMNEVKALL